MNRSVPLLMIVALLAGCTTLPRDGPSGRAIAAGAENPDALGGYALVEMDYAVAERIRTLPPRYLGSLAGVGASAAPTDVIGVGDTLQISVFEPSGSLFGGGSSGNGVRSGTQTLPPIVVDRSGAVGVPFAGSVNVSGLTAPEAAAAIRRALVGRVGNPQVTVAIAEHPSSSVIVLGEVRQPGRAALTVNADRILDVIAAAGGSPRAVEDVMVNVRRGEQTFSAPLWTVTNDFDQNVRLQRGDQVNLAYHPRRFSTFGALGAVSQTEMGSGPVTLAAALSRVGGLDTRTANARSVMVFRFERPEVAQALGLTQPATAKGVPVVYRLNLAEGSGFFTAGAFMVESEDILYVPLAGAAEARKFFEFVQTVTRVIYDVSVTSAVNVD